MWILWSVCLWSPANKSRLPLRQVWMSCHSCSLSSAAWLESSRRKNYRSLRWRASRIPGWSKERRRRLPLPDLRLKGMCAKWSDEINKLDYWEASKTSAQVATYLVWLFVAAFFACVDNLLGESRLLAILVEYINWNITKELLDNSTCCPDCTACFRWDAKSSGATQLSGIFAWNNSACFRSLSTSDTF